MNDHPWKVQPAEQRRLADMYATGMSVMAVRRETGYAHATILKAVRAMGGTVRPQGHENPSPETRFKTKPPLTLDERIREKAMRISQRRKAQP